MQLMKIGMCTSFQFSNTKLGYFHKPESICPSVVESKGLASFQQYSVDISVNNKQTMHETTEVYNFTGRPDMKRMNRYSLYIRRNSLVVSLL